jgi:phospholipid/cholesterol/gamma-HCH transport system substrate-binding protein
VRWLTRAVSVVVFVAVAAALLLLIRSKMPATHIGQGFRAWALFRDGSRLATGSPVMIAGVRVGEVTSLGIVDGLARLDMKLVDDVHIPEDSWITKKAESAFGDSYLEILPTGGDEGAPNARMLKSGERITHVIEGSSTDSALRAMAQTMPKIDNGLNAMHDVALNGRDWVHGTLEERVGDVDHWLDEGHLDKPLATADHAMERFETGTTRAADAVAHADVNGTFDTIDKAVASARKQMANLKTGLHDGLASARDGMDRIDPQIAQAQDVMAAINEGSGADWKGTLGRLVNKPQLADDIEDATDSLKESTASFARFKSYLGLRAEYNIFSNIPRVYLTAEIRSRSDKFYLVELEKGGLGSIPSDQLSDVPGTGEFTRYQQIRDELRFTAQFGKQFGWFQIRGGIKESTFGAGFDILSGRLKISTDVFGAYDRTPRLKVTAAYEVLRHAYIIAGIDDMLNKPGYLPIITGNTDVPKQFDKIRYGRDYFLGGTLYFTDEDLSTLIRVYGALLVSLL